MVKVFIILLISIACGSIVESDYISSIGDEHGYLIYSIAWSLVYIIPSSVGVIISRKMLDGGGRLPLMLVAVISLCMAISASLSLMMITPSSFNLLSGVKIWWQNAYLSIEILAALIVGGNGFSYLAHVHVCAHGKRSAIIGCNTNPNSGEQ